MTPNQPTSTLRPPELQWLAANTNGLLPIIENGFPGLSERQRVVIAHQLFGASDSDIAALFGCGREAVRSHARKAANVLGAPSGRYAAGMVLAKLVTLLPPVGAAGRRPSQPIVASPAACEAGRTVHRPAPPDSADPRYAVPPFDRHRHVPPEEFAAFMLVDRLARDGEAPSVLLVGPPGCGKTSAAEYFAALTGRPFCDVPASVWLDAGDALGRTDLRDGRTDFRLAPWLTFIETVPGGVILIDEVNRADSLKALNVLLPLLDHRRAIAVDQLGRSVRRGAGTVLFATINRDPLDLGTEPLPEALRSRFYVLRAGFPPEAAEVETLVKKTAIPADKARRIVRLAAALRGDRAQPLAVSIRQTLAVARLVALDGELSLVGAVRLTFMHAFDGDESETLAQKIHQTALAHDWARA
jgi:hypothetical protein